jgi:6-phosphogluconolactonase
MIRERRLRDPELAAAALAARVAGWLADALDRRPAATLVVSGGATPVPFFRRLSRLDLPWSRVRVTLADERWVEPWHADSNEGLVRRELLVNRAASARWSGLKTAAPTPEEGCAEAAARLAALQPIEVAVLGLGADGHTASLFPRAPGVEAALDPRGDATVVAVRPPEAHHSRLSLTLAALLGSRRLALHLTGDEKWRVYRRAVDAGPAADLPVRALLQGSAERIEVYWAPNTSGKDAIGENPGR